jgi:hypothetical protein
LLGGILYFPIFIRFPLILSLIILVRELLQASKLLDDRDLSNEDRNHDHYHQNNDDLQTKD